MRCAATRPRVAAVVSTHSCSSVVAELDDHIYDVMLAI
jgi:hypothetical protein